MVQTTDTQAGKLDRAARRQTLHHRLAAARALRSLVAWSSALNSTARATFRLSLPTRSCRLPDLVVPAAPFIFVGRGILAFLGARQFLRGGVRWMSAFARHRSLAGCGSVPGLGGGRTSPSR